MGWIVGFDNGRAGQTDAEFSIPTTPGRDDTLCHYLDGVQQDRRRLGDLRPSRSESQIEEKTLFSTPSVQIRPSTSTSRKKTPAALMKREDTTENPVSVQSSKIALQLLDNFDNLETLLIPCAFLGRLMTTLNSNFLPQSRVLPSTNSFSISSSARSIQQNLIQPINSVGLTVQHIF
ncbi:hypothetical protein BLNAU_1566 [Blattamonas nauphoetae]|uniref:Uncharacterized protein n=1 Tax=Blattamonas nauphoetae TaxID=2049346 RepID=A0ABQ9YIE5_9EUKA|nr:hypothetical protein BLNAU_1566 [Blattamonas nauphoetae]